MHGSINPLRDIEVIETELLLSDIQALERKIEKLQKLAKSDKLAKQMLDDAEVLLKFLNEGKQANLFPEKEKESVKLII